MVVLIGTILLFIWAAFSDMCNNELRKEVPIAKSGKRVVVFERDCGATTGFSTQLSILDRDESLGSSSGNIFIADSNHGKAPSSSNGGPKVQIYVVSPTKIEIRYDKRARVFKRESRFDGITIEYKILSE